MSFSCLSSQALSSLRTKLKLSAQSGLCPGSSLICCHPAAPCPAAMLDDSGSFTCTCLHLYLSSSGVFFLYSLFRNLLGIVKIQLRYSLLEAASLNPTSTFSSVLPQCQVGISNTRCISHCCNY